MKKSPTKKPKDSLTGLKQRVTALELEVARLRSIIEVTPAIKRVGQ